MFRIIIGAGIMFLLALQGLCWAQTAPTCEDQLAQKDTQLTLTQTSRAQGEYIAGDALAALRKMNTQLQTRVQELEKERQAAKTSSETPLPTPPSP